MWLWRLDGKVGPALIHVDVWDEVFIKPVGRELQVVERCTQKVETTGFIQMLKTQQVLGKKVREISRERSMTRE